MTAAPEDNITLQNGNTSDAFDNVNDGASSVQVAVRVRPMLPHEAGNTQCIEVLRSSASATTSTVVRLGGESGPKFTFDQVFPLTTEQHDVYQHRVEPLVKSCLEGYNATILAYGQTGSGKTHTIMGPSASITTAIQDERKAGVIPRAIRRIFEQLEGWTSSDNKDSSDDRSEDDIPRNSGDKSYEYDVRVQFLEVYGQEIRDLLTTTQQSNKKLSIRDVGLAEPEVVGATEIKVESAEEALLCLTRGMYRRVTGATAMNETSSRSHAIFSLIVEQSTVVDQMDDGAPRDREQHVQAKRSKFNFVDLAGSERQKRTQASGQRLKEGININQGLLVLGNVISALGDPTKQGKTFVPYRDSNLTRLLKGSLGGNHKTLMIACVSPASNNMEETLNCLRYANRAKNIQNHAVVNVDGTSRLLAELKAKMQLLASDLLKARDGNVDSLSVPLEVVRSLAKGGDGEMLSSQASFMSPLQMRTKSPFVKENIAPMTSAFKTQAELELQHVRAENEVFRLKIESLTSGKEDPTEALQSAFVARVEEYEREIETLRERLSTSGIPQPDFGKDDDDHPSVTSFRSGSPSRILTHNPDSPELSRLRAQMFGSMAQAKNLDAEMEAEEKAVAALTTKYLGRNGGDDEDGDENPAAEAEEQDACAPDFTVQLEAEVFELSHSINVKEELIQKLQVSQKKYEAMREFYEEKLREMATLLAEKEHETEKLSEELSKLDHDHSDKPKLTDQLKEKQEQVAALKRKQAELTRLTTVASKNESQIAKLTHEVTEMKHKKVELQKQVTAERKSHAVEVQKLKKESMQQQRELNKVKQEREKKALEAEKAQQVAKVRLQEVVQLKSKYKESEKQLRILTVKRGVMSRAGLDPVMVGRRQNKTSLKSGMNQSASEQQNEDQINIDSIRDFFDQKVADIGRREALAEKLAQEWEEHLDLSSQREELLEKASEEDKESLDALDSRIKYKEDRIRQLAARLGKPKRQSDEKSAEDDTFLFSKDFKNHVGNSSPLAATKLAAKVLFGMVVRERRRIAALARTASTLDEKVREGEAAVAAKDAAFRAYVDEQRLEAAELAENQQQHILSLMNMVREDPDKSSSAAELSSPVRSAKARHAEKANSKLLLLANERIAVLERQLAETQLGREAIQKHRDRENEARALLEEKTRECEDLEDELNELRTAMRRIREEVTIHEDLSVNHEDEGQPNLLSKSVLDIVVNSLHPSFQSSDPSSPKRRRRSSTSKGILTSQGLCIRRQTELVHTSDSDEVPDWADDIMKDLEIIAKGEMPTSLMESPDVVNAEVQLENESVFDRLNNPKSFTGVQKKRAQKQIKQSRNGADFVSDGQRQRKMISKQVANSLDKLAVLGNPSSSKTHVRRSSKDSEKDEDKKRSVFDRLLSPSNLTGTQKQRFQDKKGKRDSDRSPEEDQGANDEKPRTSGGNDSTSLEADELLHELLDDSDPAGPRSKVPQGVVKSEASRKREEYKELDVFERLNKTTTQAYAVKQHVNIAEKMLDELLFEDSERSEDHFRQDKSRGKSSDHIKGSRTNAISTDSFSQVAGRVLDDLLDNSTSNVENSSSDIASPVSSRIRSRRRAEGNSPEQPQKEYPDVFERLQKTTTEAFDLKKTSPQADQ